MKLCFKEATFKNVLSFGNKPTTITFNDGLNLLTGHNGSGKSTLLLDVLSYGLTGQPYRKIRLQDLINRKNQKNLEVVIKFDINDDKYKLTRGMKPSILKIEKNNIEQKSLSSSGLNQIEIDKIIGINYNIFKQIISLSINHNEPFLKLGLPKKREIRDQVFSIDIFTDMLKLVKSEIKDLKPKIAVSDNTVTLLDQTINSDKNTLNELKQTEQRFEEDKQNEIKTYDLEIEECIGKLKDIKSNGENLIKDLKNQVINNRTELDTTKSNLVSEIAGCEIEIKNSKKTTNVLLSYDDCPTCNSKILPEYKTKEINKLKKHINTNIERCGVCNIELEEVESDIESLEFQLYKQEVKKNNIQTLKDKAIALTSQVNTAKKRKTLVASKEFTFDIKGAEHNLSIKQKDLKKTKVENDEFKLELKRKNTIVDVLSDTGIKSYVFEKMIPILNLNINDYLKLFKLPVTIKFNKYMEETITVLGNGLMDVSYYSFSEGEKKRIDMAILLSFIAIKKSLAVWNCNLLIIDELLDSSIDDDGLDQLIDSINNMITDENGLGVYIISHRLKKEYFSQFKSLTEISKKRNGFSSIKNLKG